MSARRRLQREREPERGVRERGLGLQGRAHPGPAVHRRHLSVLRARNAAEPEDRRLQARAEARIRAVRFPFTSLLPT